MKKTCFFLLLVFLSIGPLFAESKSDYRGMKGLLEILRDEEEEAFIGIDFIEDESGIYSEFSQALILNVYDDSVLFETYYGAFVCIPLDKIRYIETEWRNNPERKLFDAAAQLEEELEKE